MKRLVFGQRKRFSSATEGDEGREGEGKGGRERERERGKGGGGSNCTKKVRHLLQCRVSLIISKGRAV